MAVIRSAMVALIGITPLLFAANALTVPLGAAASAKAAEDTSLVLSRAQVWRATNIPSMNLKAGPPGPGAFPFRAEIECDYLNKELSGLTPKFACMTSKNDELKVKFGGGNGEVYAEVAASRLLWALGFGADHMYSVKVICRGCPVEFGGIARANGDRIFDPAAVERKMPGAEIAPGWSWKDLDRIDEKAGGAPLAHRDALKLMAVFLQHTDSKPEQQRLICLGVQELAPGGNCAKPFMLIQDVGVTFGRANFFNQNKPGSMNLVAWSGTPVWKTNSGPCVGNLPKSFSGSLDDPVISEAGRQMLAGLMRQLTDNQLRDLFEAARVTLRVREPGDPRSGFPTVDEWVAAFKQRRAEILNRRCA